MAKEKDFLAQMLEKFGNDVFDSHNKKVEAISTGSLSLDSSIGIGGIPKGMITELYGPEGSGKTTIALNTSRTVANAGGKVLYIDVENLLNVNILTAVLGETVETENIIFLTPDSAEDAFTMAEKAIESQEFELIVIDSIGSMASKKEKEEEFDKQTMMVLPRLVGKFIKRNVYQIRTTNVALLVLNQVRDNVGSYVKSYQSPGGHIMKHQTAVRIALTKGQDLKMGSETVGILAKFVIKKNKLAPPFRSFTIPILFGEGIDFYSDLLDFAVLIGVIQRKGSHYKFGDIGLGIGKVNSRETLMNSKETLDNIVETVYNVVNHEKSVTELLNDLEDEVEEGEDSGE